MTYRRSEERGNWQWQFNEHSVQVRLRSNRCQRCEASLSKKVKWEKLTQTQTDDNSPIHLPPFWFDWQKKHSVPLVKWSLFFCAFVFSWEHANIQQHQSSSTSIQPDAKRDRSTREKDQKTLQYLQSDPNTYLQNKNSLQSCSKSLTHIRKEIRSPAASQSLVSHSLEPRGITARLT